MGRTAQSSSVSRIELVTYRPLSLTHSPSPITHKLTLEARSPDLMLMSNV